MGEGEGDKPFSLYVRILKKKKKALQGKEYACI